MNCEYDLKNPLLRDGTSQKQRYVSSLDPSYVSVDERNMDELLLYTRKYADYVRHYDRKNDPNTTESWAEFFKNSIAILIAEIKTKDLDAVRGKYIALRKEIEGKSINDNNKAINKKYKALLQYVINIAKQIDDWYSRSIETLSLHQDLKILINSSLSNALEDLISYEKGAVDALIDWSPIEPDYLFSKEWRIKQVSIVKDSTIYESENIDADNKEKILSALEHINSLYEVFFGALKRIVSSASDYMIEALEKYPYHQPHISLFLSFLKLFQYAQNHLNKITERHLDFYYREILQLKEKPEAPDKVHVLFELAKQVNSHKLKEGTLLKAGKDASGVDVLYKIDRDIVVNKAKVDQLKTLFIDRDDNYRIYSAPKSNSKDGLGKKFDVDEPKWKTFGENQKTGKNLYRNEDERTMQYSEIGFAIASPIFFLNEGDRTIIIKLHIVNTLFQNDMDINTFKIYLSGEKEWIEVEPDNITIDIPNVLITITINLQPSNPPVIAYNANDLGGTCDTVFPVMKIILNNNPQEKPVYAYEKLKDLTVTQIDLEVKVGVNEDDNDKIGVKNLVLQNDFGVLDPVKPFLPFGPTPAIDSSLYIGSKEIFQKRLKYLELEIDWKDVPTDDLTVHYANYGTHKPEQNSDFKAQFKILIDKDWKNLNSQKDLFATNVKEKHQVIFNCNKDNVFDVLDDYGAEVIREELTEYKSDTKRGFIKMELKLPFIAFGHRIFRDVYTKSIIRYADDPSPTNEGLIPNEPYTPQINSITLNYKAKESIDLQDIHNFEQRTTKVFHIYPFGHKEVHKKLEEPLYLLPQFESTVDDIQQEDEGELYIGVSKLEPQQNISLFFQVAEGSSDPVLTKEEVNWSYLSQNTWLPFQKDEIMSDTTNGLITSGIITFAIPKEANKDNTVLPAKLHWLRASVHQNSRAVSDMIDIQAQAVQASFTNNDNDPYFLAQSLPKETISKLQVKDAAVKTVTQPYASFNGKIKEQSSQFYTRVSERLRHKARTVNIWDYERLVLEKFPSLYKAKCLNHTNSSSEVVPGSVTIVTISNVRNKNAVDKLKPMTSVNTLEEIKTYICKLKSRFVTLEVVNPLYEEIQTKFKVRFHEGKDKGFYTKQLNEDIKKFLSPWAFDEGADITFGGKIHGSYIINFVEERDYVDYITDFELYQIVNNVRTPHIEEAVAKTSRSILVSYNKHDIK